MLAILGNGGAPPPRAQHLSPPSLSPAPALDSAAAGDLTDALCEFDAVLADFASPFHERHFHYEEHLERMKRRSSASVSDSSGFSDSESKCGPNGECARARGTPSKSTGGPGLRLLICKPRGGAPRSEPKAPRCPRTPAAGARPPVLSLGGSWRASWSTCHLLVFRGRKV